MTATDGDGFGAQPGGRVRTVLWIAGIGSVLLGCLAILFPIAATLGVELTFGAILIATGLLEAARGLMLRRSARMLWSLMFGAVAVAAGAVLVLYPLGGMVTLTVVLAAFFLAGGAFRIAAALILRPLRNWGWFAASGVLSVVLGLVILAGLPGTALWSLGLLIGIDLVVLGGAQIAIARALSPA